MMILKLCKTSTNGIEYISMKISLNSKFHSKKSFDQNKYFDQILHFNDFPI